MREREKIANKKNIKIKTINRWKMLPPVVELKLKFRWRLMCCCCGWATLLLARNEASIHLFNATGEGLHAIHLPAGCVSASLINPVAGQHQSAGNELIAGRRRRWVVGSSCVFELIQVASTWKPWGITGAGAGESERYWLMTGWRIRRLVLKWGNEWSFLIQVFVWSWLMWRRRWAIRRVLNYITSGVELVVGITVRKSVIGCAVAWNRNALDVSMPAIITAVIIINCRRRGIYSSKIYLKIRGGGQGGREAGGGGGG